MSHVPVKVLEGGTRHDQGGVPGQRDLLFETQSWEFGSSTPMYKARCGSMRLPPQCWQIYTSASLANFQRTFNT